jgi:hypothetical protein
MQVRSTSFETDIRFVDGEPVGNLTRDDILDNITLYWLTGTGVSAARNYWEDARALAAARSSGQPPPAFSVPVGFTTFPGEIWASPRSWSRRFTPGSATARIGTALRNGSTTLRCSCCPRRCALSSKGGGPDLSHDE